QQRNGLRTRTSRVKKKSQTGGEKTSKPSPWTWEGKINKEKSTRSSDAATRTRGGFTFSFGGARKKTNTAVAPAWGRGDWAGGGGGIGRGASAENPSRRCSRRFERCCDLRLRYGRSTRRYKVPWRFRGASKRSFSRS